jgi:ribosomal protein S18 acetylase RimI-like enzyme
MSAIILHTTGLTAGEYRTIKESAKWGPVPDNEYIAMALARSLHVVVARDGGKAVGMARLLGDGVFYWHVQDVVILPEYQGRGVGAMLMEHLLGHIKAHMPGDGTNVGLFAAEGKEGFYAKLGFKTREEQNRGAAMETRISRNP